MSAAQRTHRAETLYSIDQSSAFPLFVSTARAKRASRSSYASTDYILGELMNRRLFRTLAVAVLLFSASSVHAAVAIDVNISADRTSGATTVASPSFSTSAPNELLLAFVATDAANGTTAAVTGVAGAGLTWSLVVRSNAQAGTSEIWRAFAPAQLTGVAVTATVSQATVSSITVLSFTGVDTSGVGGAGAIGAIAKSNAAAGAPSASLVTTRAGSWVFGVGNDWDSPIPR